MKEAIKVIKYKEHEGQPNEYDKRWCARCRIAFGRIINRGSFCPCCKKRVCKSCREYNVAYGFNRWLCTKCYKEIDMDNNSSEWFTLESKRDEKSGIHRSLTFTDTSSSPWAAIRGSPELRLYSSMPRNQENGFKNDIFICCKNNLQTNNKMDGIYVSNIDEVSQNENVEDNITPIIRLVDSFGTLLELPTINAENDSTFDSADAFILSQNQTYNILNSGSVAIRPSKFSTNSNLPPGITPPRKRRFVPNDEFHGDNINTSDINAATKFLVPDIEDYRLVFISSSDSSLHSNDSSSNGSTLAISPSNLQGEDCDWDYFECNSNFMRPFKDTNTETEVDNNQINSTAVNKLTNVSMHNKNVGCDIVSSGGKNGQCVDSNDLREMVGVVTTSAIEGVLTQSSIPVSCSLSCNENDGNTTDTSHSITTGSQFVGRVYEHTSPSLTSPILIPIFVPIPVILPVPLSPDFTIRVERALSSLSSSTTNNETYDQVDSSQMPILMRQIRVSESSVVSNNIDINGTSTRNNNNSIGFCDKNEDQEESVVLTSYRVINNSDEIACSHNSILQSQIEMKSETISTTTSKQFYRNNVSYDKFQRDFVIPGEEDNYKEDKGRVSLNEILFTNKNSKNYGEYDLRQAANELSNHLEEISNTSSESDSENIETIYDGMGENDVNEESNSIGTSVSSQIGINDISEKCNNHDYLNNSCDRNVARLFTNKVNNVIRTEEIENISMLSNELDSIDGQIDTYDIEVDSITAEGNKSNFKINIDHNDAEETFENEQNGMASYMSLIMIGNPRANQSDMHIDVRNDSSNQSLKVSENHNVENNAWLNDYTVPVANCLEEGLADDDSWVEELDHEDMPITTDDSSGGEEDSFIHSDENYEHYRTAIDFTLHTIIEESDLEDEDSDIKEQGTQLEKYFFDIGDSNADLIRNKEDTDDVSDTSSIVSEEITSSAIDTVASPTDRSPSRLEKYFISELAKFRRDSDGSVGSDSEGDQSPDHRKKRLIKPRNTCGRQLLPSPDNISELEQHENYSLSDDLCTEYKSEEDNYSSYEKTDGQLSDSSKKKKSKKRCTLENIENNMDSKDECTKFITHSEDNESSNSNSFKNKTFVPNDEYIANSITNKNVLDSGEDFNITKNDPTEVVIEKINDNSAVDDKCKELEAIKINPKNKIENAFINVDSEGLCRKDSFNNWSSDEETNLMMSKMKTFFKTMIANHKNTGNSPTLKKRDKPQQLVYFERELARLMKTVPGIRDEQVREIIEYLSSEDTWSDSCDSSDYTSSDLEGVSRKINLNNTGNLMHNEVQINMENKELKTDTALVYQRLMASLGKIENTSVSRNSPPLITKVMQHIGSRLVALMHQVSDGASSTCRTANRYHRRPHSNLSIISTTTEEEDDSAVEDYCPLPRSKSHDPLLEESRQETASDNERISWRGSFESAIKVASDSRTRLASASENSASALALAAAKRRSAGDLLFKSGNSREQLDRVRSCGSIGGSIEDKLWSLKNGRKRRGSVPDATSNSGESADGDNDSDDDDTAEQTGRSTTLPRTLHSSCFSTTNSLPRLPTVSAVSVSSNIYKTQSVHQFNVKSARYRPPGYGTRLSAGSPSSLSVPPRRDNNRRRSTPPTLQISPAVISSFSSSDKKAGYIHPDDKDRVKDQQEDSDKPNYRILSPGVTRSDSMVSVYSGAGEGRYGIVPVKGEIEFGLQYNYKAGDLEIHIKQCKDLAPVDIKRNRSDPYVKVYLLPDKSKSGKRKTRVRKHNLNPVFDEVLKYHLTLEELEARTLWLSVWHSDIFGRNDFLGEVIITLSNKVFDDPMPKFYLLQERSELLDDLSSSRGELIVALKFVPPSECSLKKRGNKGSLHVLIKEAKNLTTTKSNNSFDPFCKSYLLPNKSRSCKQKTPILKRTCNPVWNHTLVYNNVTLEEMHNRGLELTIWDHDRLSSNEFLGGVKLSTAATTNSDGKKCLAWMDPNSKEASLWQRMIERPNFWVEGCLILRPSLDIKSCQ